MEHSNVEKNKIEKGSDTEDIIVKPQMVKNENNDLKEITNNEVKRKIWNIVRRFNHATSVMNLATGNESVPKPETDIDRRKDPEITFVKLLPYMPPVMVIGVPSTFLKWHL